MPNLQRELLAWAAAQPVLTGLLLLTAGAVYGFFGFRMFKFLLVLTCAGLGWFAGGAAAIAADLPTQWLSPAGAVALVLLSLKCEKPSAVLASGCVWGALGYYIAAQLHLSITGTWLTGGLACAFGVLFSLLSYRTMMVVLTVIQGAVLLVVGWVTVSTRVVPSVGVTFRHWANSQSLLIPIFLAMLVVTAYSYQAMHQQGDIRTGR